MTERIIVKSIVRRREERTAVKQATVQSSRETVILRSTEGVPEHNGAMLPVTVGDGNVTSAGKMATGGIRRKNRGRKGRSEVAGDKDQAGERGDAEVADMSGAVSATIGHAKGGGTAHGTALPE